MCVMTADTANVVKCTPKIEELLPNYVYNIKCTEPECESTFRNSGQYQLHMVAHHRKPRPLDKVVTAYHCPIEKCIYHTAQLSGRCCSSLSLLRQHYRKVHLPRNFVCEACGKAFVKDTELQKHQTDGTCGYVWECNECGWKYGSREALLTHSKRKGHKFEVKTAIVPAVKKPLSEENLPKKRNGAKTVKSAAKRQHIVFPTKGTMTTFEAQQRSTVNDLPDFDLRQLLCDTETQTEKQHVGHVNPASAAVSNPVAIQTSLKLRRGPPTTPPNTEKHTQTGMVGAMLSTANVDLATQQELHNVIDIATLLCNMETRTKQRAASTSTTPPDLANTYTQTCGELLKELDLLEPIETQSQIPVMESQNDDRTYLMNWPTNMRDDLRVSTATQTSFEQYLLNTELGLQHIDTQVQTQTESINAKTQTRRTPYLILSDVTLEPPAAPVQERVTVAPGAQDPVQLSSGIAIALSSADFLVTTETQTSFTQCLLDTDLALADMETQTNCVYSESTRVRVDTPPAIINENVPNCLRADDFLVSTETQTSYEQCLLNPDLSLADIETQTNWTYDGPQETKEVFSGNGSLSMLHESKSCAGTGLSCDDFLVSTETQTNFEQHLLANSLSTTDLGSNDGLYTTQYTQTCDELFSEFFFGEQENFQSVYTQT